MVPIVQSPLPVVSTEYFSFGPNEGLSIQDFLRDLIRSSSRAAKINFIPPDQENVTHQSEPLVLPLILETAAIPAQLQSSSTNVSNNGPSPLHQPPAPKESDTRKHNVLRVDSHLDCGVTNTKSPRIVHTYSKKQKGISQEFPTSATLPPLSPPSTRLGDQQHDASVYMGTGVRRRDQGVPGIIFDEHIPPPPPRAANAAISEALKRKPERTIREERPVKGKKRCRRAPVEGLVLIHRISDEGAHRTEPEVSWNSASPTFARKVLLRILVFHVAFDPYEEDRKLTSFSMNKIPRKTLTLTAILSRVRILPPSHHQHQVVDDQPGTRTRSQLEDRSVLRSPMVKVMWIPRTFEFHNGSLHPRLIGFRSGHRAVALVGLIWISLAKESASNPRY